MHICYERKIISSDRLSLIRSVFFLDSQSLHSESQTDNIRITYYLRLPLSIRWRFFPSPLCVIATSDINNFVCVLELLYGELCLLNHRCHRCRRRSSIFLSQMGIPNAFLLCSDIFFRLLVTTVVKIEYIFVVLNTLNSMGFTAA